MPDTTKLFYVKNAFEQKISYVRHSLTEHKEHIHEVSNLLFITAACSAYPN